MQNDTTLPDNDTQRRQVAILARSIYREMCSQGFRPEQMIGVSSMLLELVHDDLCEHRSEALHAAE